MPCASDGHVGAFRARSRGNSREHEARPKCTKPASCQTPLWRWGGGLDQHGRHVRRPSRTADLLAFATASATPPATRSHWQALRLVPAWAAQVPFSMNALASTAASASAPLVGPKVEMAAHNGNNASATRAFKFNLRVDWETQARNAIPSKFQFNTIQCNYN